MSKPLVYDALVLDALWRQSLITVRSLGRRGLRVAALEMADRVPTFTSRWCQQSFSAPAYAEGAEGYLSYLEDVLDQTQARVLMPSSDGTIAVIRQQREQLERRVRIPLANEAALDIAVNKERTLEIAQQLGLNIPRGVTIATVHEVTAAIHEVGLPAVVKPVESWLWGEQYGARLVGQLVTTLDEAKQVVEAITSFGGNVLFQQFLSGRNEAISFMYAHDHTYARFAQWAKRTDPPLGGTSVLRQSIPLPSDTAGQAEQLIREIGLEGYSEVEFRRDANGVAYLMEINPRLSASVEVAVHAGVDFPYLLYQWATGERIGEVKSYSTGLWMRYLRGDFMTTLGTLRERGRPGVQPPTQAIRDFCLTFFMPVHYDYLDWHDPRPAGAKA
ncbi:MAG: hypothetical protein NVS4B7_10230 [Ktedonobacteraceae bacterium]